ncbi:Serpentine receptor class alpha-29 [Caenorhabditis elegans]|uniref:Serpentine receptor class alpha-29 n=1 Tax=Caenorhabditis elegans TaxID=6239 RepID=SRA29_CAEEL|nr:Serpentine receptor class alpha-29 [Caenorhabditis elegans]Q19552.1 RecName: Full=Serpentine receptor class alpha-29; Short=Protein sra-29 [Caenorhabditis elegans]CCD68198.1 Serpentine receptor class alpha-29 [Caenorhabditis elegans]|eukprot:NP_001293505.1 Serpentine receptor class alpha-29 [Caenorhabditis elegans]
MENLNPACASEDVKNALTSPIMMLSHGFILMIIVVSFITTALAVQTLWYKNVFPFCTKNLLLSAIVNGIFHQSTVAEIRLKTVYHLIRYSNAPCSILFQSSDCFYDNFLYYQTALFSSFYCVSLFLDRLFSLNPRSFYNSHQTLGFIVFLILQIICPIAIQFWTFHDSDYTSYVPMCNYPPASSVSGTKFYFINDSRIIIMGTIFMCSLFLYIHNKSREKRMIFNVYNTDSRYKSYENFLATRAVCIIIFSQITCLGITSFVPSIFNQFRQSISPDWFHLILAFMAGATYSNFFLPLIVIYETQLIIAHRHKLIKKLKSQKEEFSDHFASLDFVWEREANKKKTQLVQ